VLLPLLGGRHICFRYNATSGDIVDNPIEQLDLDNMGRAVGILSVGILELEITLEVFYPISIMCM